MFASRYFGQRYYAKRYFPRGISGGGGGTPVDLLASLFGSGVLLGDISATASLQSFIDGTGFISTAVLVDGNAPPPTELPELIAHVVHSRMGSR